MIEVKRSEIEIPPDIVSFVYQLKEQNLIHKARSTRGGWTTGNVSDIPLLANVNVQAAWFSVNTPRAYNEWHDHLGIPTSGVIYIETPKNSGNIEFSDGEETLSIEPYKGLMITFPGDLKHRVLVNNSEEDRICLVFNTKG